MAQGVVKRAVEMDADADAGLGMPTQSHRNLRSDGRRRRRRPPAGVGHYIPCCALIVAIMRRDFSPPEESWKLTARHGTAVATDRVAGCSFYFQLTGSVSALQIVQMQSNITSIGLLSALQPTLMISEKVLRTCFRARKHQSIRELRKLQRPSNLFHFIVRYPPATRFTWRFATDR